MLIGKGELDNVILKCDDNVDVLTLDKISPNPYEML